MLSTHTILSQGPRASSEASAPGPTHIVQSARDPTREIACRDPRVSVEQDPALPDAQATPNDDDKGRRGEGDSDCSENPPEPQIEELLLLL